MSGDILLSMHARGVISIIKGAYSDPISQYRTISVDATSSNVVRL